MSRIAFGIQAHRRGAALDDAGDHLIRQPPGLDSLKVVKAIGKATGKAIGKAIAATSANVFIVLR